MTTPQQFAEYLKKSTLSVRAQQAVLKYLSSLSSQSIQEWAEILQKDNEGQEECLRKADLKIEVLKQKFCAELEEESGRKG